ncbi:DnaJ family domain-containing protein [Arthrobacter halodurans]|uniref:DUF1992 domain-containing protein n=1 Tax=Arthrobacter halodurans TaxID=516699 RepID=A0ABV4UM55_9MICC
MEPQRGENPRLRAARYREAAGTDPDSPAAGPADAATGDAAAGGPRPPAASGIGLPEAVAPTGSVGRRLLPTDEVYEVSNKVIDAAMARGDFDNLAYAGKPLPDLGGTDDPDWWVKGLIQREKLTGLGPPALLLRREDAELDARMDRLHSERAVRAALEDFNARIVEARRQLLGGPPVVTPVRDIDAELRRWRERRSVAPAAEDPRDGGPTSSWWNRWRNRRRARDGGARTAREP